MLQYTQPRFTEKIKKLRMSTIKGKRSSYGENVATSKKEQVEETCRKQHESILSGRAAKKETRDGRRRFLARVHRSLE